MAYRKAPPLPFLDRYSAVESPTPEQINAMRQAVMGNRARELQALDAYQRPWQMPAGNSWDPYHPAMGNDPGTLQPVTLEQAQAPFRRDPRFMAAMADPIAPPMPLPRGRLSFMSFDPSYRNER